ncbi:hypothetical protein Plhal703r1_c17g0078551 [Plasmopara halstedii]
MQSRDTVSPQAPDRMQQNSPLISHATDFNTSDEWKQPSARRPATQRLRTVRILTQVHPDLLIPYLYNERGSRSINAIVHSTGCTIDYCALSPNEPERSPQSQAYVMNFLMSARSRETLESAIRQLNTLVERVQVFFQKKARVSQPARSMDELYNKRNPCYEPVNNIRDRRDLKSRIYATDAMAFDGETLSNNSWTFEEAEEDWNVARGYYTLDGYTSRKRPGYRNMSDVESDEKSDFMTTGRHFDGDFAETKASCASGNRFSGDFGASRRARRYPGQSWVTSRSYPNHVPDPEYSMYTDALQSERKPTQRIMRDRQPRYTSNIYDQSVYGPHEYEDPYEDEIKLTYENERYNAPQYMRRMHSKRSLKRPLSNVRSDRPAPPPIYRQRYPLRAEYAYDDEEDEWMIENEDMAYGYDPQSFFGKMPAFRREHRIYSGDNHRWSNFAAPGHLLPQMYKRRCIPRENVSVEDDEMVCRGSPYEHVIRDSSRPTTERMDQHDHVVGNAESQSVDAQHITDRIDISAEDESSVSIMSDSSFGNAVVDAENRQFLANDSIAANSAINLAVDSAGVKSGSSARVSELDQTNDLGAEVFQSACDRGVESDLEQNCVSFELDSQSTTSLETSDVKADVASLAKSNVISLSPSNLPVNRVESPTCSTTKEAGCNVPCDVTSAATSSDEKVERPQLIELNVSREDNLPFQASTTSDTGEFNPGDSKHTPLGSVTSSTMVDNVLTDTIRINNHIIASLERVNKVEADFVLLRKMLTEQKGKYHQLSNRSTCYHRLAVSCGMIYKVQYQLSLQPNKLNETRKQKVLEMLDHCLENLLIDGEQTLQEKTAALQHEVEHILAVHGLGFLNGESIGKSVISGHGDKEFSSAHSNVIEHNKDKSVDTISRDWENDDGYTESTSTDLARDDDLDFVSQSYYPKNNTIFEDDLSTVKFEQKTSTSRPQKMPPFVWSLLTRAISSDPQSYVMRATSKRLMDEIAKGDPYYYLHPTKIGNDTATSTSVLRSRSCEFGCGGASAVKWKRKLVSQINSRMKFFDNVAYLLARRSRGEEALNRKKMNSIIRKLHLVAMQLHSLVSHIYCIQGQARCREGDSLPTKLNSSHFARRMGVYKSKLKLVVPLTYQQQSASHQQCSADDVTEDLLQDTFEFFPELLLCVDIWGFNYRESQSKRHISKVVLSGNSAGSDVHFPLAFLREVEGSAFDFEHDNNGRLSQICDELLNLVCLWNDLKWTDSLENVALDRVLSFETDVTASISKVLDLYAHHLQALWAVRLFDDPEQLQSVHFTHLNAYYSDRSQSTTSNGTSSVDSDVNAVDYLVANAIVEQRHVEKYWNRKVTTLSVYNSDDDASELTERGPHTNQLLSIDAISSWNKDTLLRYLLRWSDVYGIRTDANVLSAVTNHMIKHEVQKHIFSRHNDESNPVEGDSMVDLSTSKLLTAVRRAQILIQDALIMAKKLALHSACHQLLNERKYSLYVEPDIIDGEVASSSDTQSLCTTMNTHNQAVSDLESHSVARGSCDAEKYGSDAQKEALDTDPAQDQPEVKDLIHLLAVTKQEMQELCGRRPRSARMREKVQTQSLQLARQTVEIFRNIRNMYEAQRR